MILNTFSRLEAQKSLDSEGCLILKNCLDPELVDSSLAPLRKAYEAARPLPWNGGGQWLGHVNYYPDPTHPVIMALCNNPQIKAILDDALGQYKVVNFVGNANLPGSGFQHAHTDGNLSLDYLIVNAALGPVTEMNGSTKVWPGSHKVKRSYRAFSLAGFKPARLNSVSGDISMRYPTLWHCGTSNKSKDVRFMLGIIAARSYDEFPPWQITASEKAIIDQFMLPVHYEVVDKVSRGFKPNFFATNLKGHIQELLLKHVPALCDVGRWLVSK